MKITMYELLGMVKDGKAPKKIKYKGIILKCDLEVQDYRIYQDGYLFTKLFEGENCKFLNDEVEILEEEKKIPEKIKDKYNSQISKVELAQKYNEIIDYLNYLKSKGDE